jgi:hypothetical protein
MKKTIFVFSFLLVIGSFVSADGNYRKIEEKIQQCRSETGESISITSTGARSVRDQARLMADMNSSQLNWYGSDTWYVIEMKKSKLSGSARVDEFERLINRARSQGSFVSRHLAGDAVDIAPADQKVKSWLLANGITIKDETVDGINCWHLQLDGYGVY